VLQCCGGAVERTNDGGKGIKEKGKKGKFGGKMRPTRCPTLEMICLLDEVFP
jgi:hypothetical protein